MWVTECRTLTTAVVGAHGNNLYEHSCFLPYFLLSVVFQRSHNETGAATDGSFMGLIFFCNNEGRKRTLLTENVSVLQTLMFEWNKL